jgi:hypothetical protein
MRHEAIISLYKNVVVVDDTMGAFDAQGNSVTVNEQAVQAEIIRLQSEYNSKQYQRDRAKEYPTIQEQLDMQYWDKINGTDTWEQAINAVKAKHPKP